MFSLYLGCLLLGFAVGYGAAMQRMVRRERLWAAHCARLEDRGALEALGDSGGPR